MNFWNQPVRSFRSLIRAKAPHIRQVRHWHSKLLERELDMDLYLPPDYFLNKQKVYPLLLLNDGQDLAQVRLAETLETLYRAKKIPYLIAVGLYANDRIHEYGTSRQFDYKQRGARAALYRDCILTEVLPFLNHRFRISGQSEHTAFAGFSLGGLSALDIAWNHPQFFGTAGIFSGALWWRWAPVDPLDPDSCRIMHDIVLNAPDRPNQQRFWFQAGTADEQDDRNNNGIIDAIDDTLHLMDCLRSKGYPDPQMRYLQMEGGEHNPATWAQAMPDFLEWTFG